MADKIELKGVLEAALSEDGGIILIRNAMAEYQSHKKVHAAVISEVHPCDEHGNFMIDITNPRYDGITIPYMVTPDMVARFTPGVGDYIVLYENDYVSFSPKGVFEGGYLMIEWPSVCANEEDAEMERDIEAFGLTAPRVTPDQIDALMRGVRYEVQVVPGTTTTLATAIAANGFTLAIGMTACADPANFNAELGAKYAIKDAEAKARQELWKLEGWRLKCHLEKPVLLVSGACQMSGALNVDKVRGVDGGSPKPSHVERMHMEQEQLAERTGKLETFIPSETFKQLPHQEQNRMKRQLVAMREYLAALNERIDAATNH
ncbi:Gp49 family protein [Aeromonas simiae]|uniref:Gp49 family protein n=1 Tax=Aeromonas simiae TaxID=218936 RepID=UPI00266B8EF6|nr:Gp49 family protein [Aeromonas simiae]MDO2946940.1 Gp49 family protein [Aeromonas simiae]MDO2954466.1 Gp49 family protein [Aeromonas simiae]